MGLYHEFDLCFLAFERTQSEQSRPEQPRGRRYRDRANDFGSTAEDRKQDLSVADERRVADINAIPREGKRHRLTGIQTSLLCSLMNLLMGLKYIHAG